jgi:hypothetical protein
MKFTVARSAFQMYPLLGNCAVYGGLLGLGDFTRQAASRNFFVIFLHI